LVEAKKYQNNGSTTWQKPKTPINNYQKTQRKKEAAERNHIEDKFEQGKNGYNLNKIGATLKSTSEN
jgi:hypothetical protein